MKLKNVSVGDWVVSKEDDFVGGILRGNKYEVLEVCGDGTILLATNCGDSWWVGVESIKKYKGV